MRGMKVPNAVKEFVQKLEEIERNREYEKPHGLRTIAEAQQRISKTDEQKISLIKSFSVPNTKEDMLEFMILATSSINMRSYDLTNTNISKSEKEISAAWFSKAQQIFEKAKRSDSTDDTLGEIDLLYTKCKEEIKRVKRKGAIKLLLLTGWIPLLVVVMIVALVVWEPKEEEKELERLDKIVIEVQQALDNGEYKHALRIADSIDYQRYDAEMERKWDIQRAYWVDIVLEEAAKKDVFLEYTPTPDVDKANGEAKGDEESEGMMEGFVSGIQSGWEFAKESMEEFEHILNGKD